MLATEPMRMIDPPSFISAKAFCTVNNVPFTLRSKSLSKCSSVRLAKGANSAMPALATRKSIFPFAFTASSSSFWRRPVMKTKAPSSTKRFAVAKPIPVVPPVTTATFPCNLPILVTPFADEARRRSACGPGWPAFRGFRTVRILRRPPGEPSGRGLAAVVPHSFRCSRDRSLLLDPGSDRRRRVAVESPVEILGDESDMRRRQQVLQRSEWVHSRQGLGIENVDRCSRDRPCAQGLDESLLVDDRAARRVD